MFKADFIQHLDLGSSPTGNCLFTLAIPHFFESLSDTVLRVLPSLVVTDRNVVNVQMGRYLVHVQDSVKNVKVRVTTLETFHILFQAVGNELKILGVVPRIFFFADLNYVLIKALSFVGGSSDSIARFYSKKMLIVAAVNLAVITFMFSIITLG